MEKQLKTGILHREFSINKPVDELARTVQLSFSSEEPAERFFGTEILDHDPSSVDLKRMNSGAPLLLNHDWDKQIGVIKDARIDADRIGRATVKFGNSDLAKEIFQDVQDGIRSKVSEIFRAVSWEPLEVSIVSVPLDNSVGVGRNAEFENHHTTIEGDVMENKVEEVKEPTPTKKPEVDVKLERSQAEQLERSRVKEILAEGKQHDAVELAHEYVAGGRSLLEFRNAVLEKYKSRPIEKQDIGLTEKEARSFSFVKAINAMTNPTDRRAQEDAAFELEVSEAAQSEYKKSAKGFLIPTDVLRRDLVVGTATAGGHTVATDLLASSFIDMLVNSTVVYPVASKLTGLVGDIKIPRQTGGATAYWVAESIAVTESAQAFDQIAMSPETVGTFTNVSRKLLIQSSIDIEAFIRKDLARTLGLEIDRVCINGSGTSNQPSGILQESGIGAVVGGTDGAAPTWAHVVDLETEITQDNADLGSLYYVTNSKVRGKLKQTEKASNTAQFVWDGSTLNGYNTLVSNQVPSNLEKGASGTVCSAIIFGNFSDLIVGLWSGLDLLVNPYSGDTSGTVRVTVLQDLDTCVRHAESFAAMTDALTA